MDIHSAIEQALKALDLLNGGHKYNERSPVDPLRKAEDRIKLFVPRTGWTQPTEDEDKNKLVTLTKMLREITDSAALSSKKYSVDVKLCDSSKESVNPISETLEYTFTGDGYTLDDLLYIVRLRRPNAITHPPFLYCRQVEAHMYTHEGSIFKRRNSWEPLKGLSRTGQGVGVVYLIAPEPKFVLLVKGAPSEEGESGKDGFYIVHKFGDQTNEIIAEHQSQTRTFYHISETSWGYTCIPNAASGVTWRQHKNRKQLTLYDGEWFVCVPQDEEA
ncbi:hypothetical protein M407DRAFT_19309 [Tulasnella calospora MUT 4182]|uniref:Uncharacterized protein n=1 Tax=Tulasnella calospora MUT 4182 TaxID=1051891 RepID=A0A0C3QID8_9AGAM|nr:hypothetical protein M407DRAFT_19309 [Tulasnella calospora MUT 4182]